METVETKRITVSKEWFDQIVDEKTKADGSTFMRRITHLVNGMKELERASKKTFVKNDKHEFSSAEERLVKDTIPHGIIPDGLDRTARECLEDLITFCKHEPRTVQLNGDRIVFKGRSFLIKRFKSGVEEKWFDELHWELVAILRKYYKEKTLREDSMYTIDELLNCEKIRADIEPYEERLLTDPNRGHWDLWTGEETSGFTVEVPENIYARNPVADIKENSVVAIDFGTKSTIVVYETEGNKSLPMRIGDGNLGKAFAEKQYENPTVMHFVNLEEFWSDYMSNSGRPKTKWEDLTISHTAIDQFSISKSEEYYEYLNQIKQWAGQRKKKFRIKDNAGYTYELPPFMELDDDAMNPIEIYAYYIGLYINNMRNGIFLSYYLSFPVTYEKEIRKRIRMSFERGLKKSLPPTILADEEVMKRFHVDGSISEPEAYAVCALQEYGFEPEGDEEVFYGIFDFGGGTTDFDFGIWKESSKKRYDYSIENVGSGGDEYLGGENLLEMLAFEVFKKNQDLMKAKKYTFTLAPKCVEFIGSDALLADSQEAEKNMHNMMEALRPYWEASNTEADWHGLFETINLEAATREDADSIEDELNSIKAANVSEANKLDELNRLKVKYGLSGDRKIEVILTLFDKDGKDHTGERLSFSEKELNDIIEKRIREGIDNFFSALTLSYQNDRVKKPTRINILLAGNSCKSPIVTRLFEEAIAEKTEDIKKECNVENIDSEGFFEIFPPLGTEAAYKKMESRNITPCRDDFEKPTGKTGVAFGLIDCRRGGTVEILANADKDEEIPFKFYIGWKSKKKFILFKDESKITKHIGKPDYNEWHKFIEADDTEFELYYTSLPECVEGNYMIDGNAAVKKLHCEIDAADPEAYVYIRAVDPHTLEYVVAKSDDVENSMMCKPCRKEL